MDAELRILCVDDEENVLSALKRVFMDEKYEVFTAASGAEGLSALREHAPVQVVLSDYRMPTMNGVEFLHEVRTLWPDTVRIVLSGYADTAAVVSAINEGQIYRFIPKPWNEDELKVTIANAFERYALHQQNVHLTQELKKRNEELLALTMVLKDRITDRVGDLETRNRKLELERTTLQFLPLPVVALDHQGAWVSYWNEQARVLFSWNAYAGTPLKRNEAFPAPVNAVLDRMVLAETENEIAVIHGRSLRVRASRTKTLGAGKHTILMFEDVALDKKN
jgi:two-component system NtrC family sensor kinase